MRDDLGRRVVRGAVWMLLARVLSNALGLINTAILARLLVPADFGLVAIATALMGGLVLLRAFSLDMSLIQNQKAERKHYDTAWTINIAVSSLISVSMVALAVPASAFYADSRVAYILYLLAIAVFVEGFNNVGIVNFRKYFMFNKEFAFMFSQRVVTVATAISLALWLRSYWALLGALMVERIFGTLLSYAMESYRPRLSLAAFRELFGFSKWLFLNNLLYFVRHRAADFIIAKVSGTQALGLYTMSYEISDLPATEMVAPINRAVFPGFAAVAEHAGALKSAYLRVMSIVALVTMPAAIGISAVAPEVVAVLLGDQWSEAAPLIAILALAGVASAAERTIGYVYIVLGKPHLLTRIYGAFVFVLVALLLLITPSYGPMGAASACLVAAVIMLPVYLRTTFRLVGVYIGEFFAIVWRPILAATLMYVAVIGSREILIQREVAELEIARLLLLVGIGAVTYVASVYAFWTIVRKPVGGERFILDQLKRLWQQRARRA